MLHGGITTEDEARGAGFRDSGASLVAWLASMKKFKLLFS